MGSLFPTLEGCRSWGIMATLPHTGVLRTPALCSDHHQHITTPLRWFAASLHLQPHASEPGHPATCHLASHMASRTIDKEVRGRTAIGTQMPSSNLSDSCVGAPMPTMTCSLHVGSSRKPTGIEFIRSSKRPFKPALLALTLGTGISSACSFS